MKSTVLAIALGAATLSLSAQEKIEVHLVETSPVLAGLQREKLAASGLGDYFEIVVVSGEFGVGKPDPSIFRHALSQLRSDGSGAVMVGDNLTRDVDGAIAAGLEGVWINRRGQVPPEPRPGLAEISTLSDLRAALSRLG